MADLPNEELVLSECYGASQTLRRLGFVSDDIYIQFGVLAADGPFAGQKCVAVCLRFQDKEFNYHVAPVKDDEAFAAKWEAFIDKANRGQVSEERLKDMVFQSFCYNNQPKLLLILKAKGIVPPTVN